MKVNFNITVEFNDSIVKDIIEEQGLIVKCSKSELNKVIKDSLRVAFKASINDTLDNRYLDGNIVDDLKGKGYLSE